MKALGWYGTTQVLDVHLVTLPVLTARPSCVTQPGYENRGVTEKHGEGRITLEKFYMKGILTRM